MAAVVAFANGGTDFDLSSMASRPTGRLFNWGMVTLVVTLPLRQRIPTPRSESCRRNFASDQWAVMDSNHRPAA